MYRLHVGSLFIFLVLAFQTLAAVQFKLSEDGRSYGWYSVAHIQKPQSSQFRDLVKTHAQQGWHEMNEDARNHLQPRQRVPAVMAALVVPGPPLSNGGPGAYLIVASSMSGSAAGTISGATSAYCESMQNQLGLVHKHGNCAEIHALAIAHSLLQGRSMRGGSVAAYGLAGDHLRFLNPCRQNEHGDRDGCIAFVAEEGLTAYTKRTMRIEPKHLLDEADQSKSTDDTPILAEH